MRTLRATSPARLQEQPPDRFCGYGLLGQAFESGDVLAFRRFDWSSIGPPFTTVWHRRPDGHWTFYTNVEPTYSCPRYYGPAVRDVVADHIELAWQGRYTLSVRVRAARLQLALRLIAPPTARLLGALSQLAPAPVWRSERGAGWVGGAAGRALGAGRLTLHGRSPSGHTFVWRPRSVWCVSAAAAVVRGAELGNPVRLDERLALGDFVIPRVGLLSTGRATYSRRE
jgi:hypothetical protein